MKKVVIIYFLLMSSLLFAQNKNNGSKDFFEALREQMKEDREQMEKYLQGDFIDRVDKMIEQMQTDFFKQYDQMLNDEQFGNILKQMELGLGDVPHRWESTKDGQKLIVEVTPMKDAPLEINILDHLITLKGTVEKVEKSNDGKKKIHSRRIFTFHQNVAIPPSLDPQTAVIEQGKSEIVVTFKNKTDKKKSVPSKTSIKSDATKKEDKNPSDVVPLNPKDGDIDL